MQYSAAAAILAFASAAVAAPQAGKPIAPPWSQSTNFRLVANVTGADLTPPINDYVLTSYHTGAGQAAAVLIPNDPTNPGRQFYVNGTAEDVRYNRANILTSGGTPPFPFGIQISPAPGTHVTINAGLGTTSVGLERFPSPVTYLTAPEAATYVACDEQLPFSRAIALNVLRTGEAVPAGCVQLRLLPQCAEGDGSVHETENTVQCYEDVSEIDWSLYID
ncbi:hypothetical protein V492_06623 [Pseudogymnoascus sp. VKM F-4246]|nr:hypothetical protein V492_06623 [Pseudogymnoascus sp. VKM F-4246]